MRSVSRLILVGTMALSPALSIAQPVSADIEFLIHRVGNSGCRFVRNGTEHAPDEATDHLRRKLAAARRELSVEQFIEHIASKSSFSGRPYAIRCSGRADEAAGDWLRRALKERSG